MQLESLEIHGFKSFGRKTKFRFTDGITAIVGPNGCGKSNIVDALRWVLGEQRAGTIRSERMENVIFNGSGTIKPLGMAEVSLKIQNTRNVLPIEYSEVVITRRLFRSLESQYLLNNVPCRLKDILNLFLDTGMGSNAYSIIELSMVESILNGNPEERRHILEEAAGVTKYKLRRKAAFRKLEATAGDIQRLDDIISEVEKNVASLQRQVKKAQRFQEIKNELKEMEIALSTHEFSGIKAELAPLTEKLQNAQDSRAELTTSLDETEAEIEEFRLQLLETERTLSIRQKELNDLAVRIHKKEEDILVDRERRKALEEAKLRFARNRMEIKTRIEKTRNQITEFKDALQHLFEKIHLAENEHQERNLELKALEINVQEKRDKLQAIENYRLQAVEGMTNSKQEEERLKTQLENVDERLASIERELEENHLLEKIRSEKIEKLNERHCALEEKLQKLSENKNVTLETIQRLAEEKEKLKEKILSKRSELQTLKERIELLKKFIESYEDHPEGVQHLLTEGFLNGGCKGTLGEALSVPSDYRRAIEAALGEAAVSLIVDETAQALKCIEVLKASEKGAVTFCPLDRFSNGRSNSSRAVFEVKGWDGVIDWASNLVNCTDAYRPMVQALLNDFVVVRDLASAREHAERFRDYRINLITLNGEVISTWGPIKGGMNGQAHAGVIGRKAQVEELESQVAIATSNLDHDERELRELTEKHHRACQAELEVAKEIKKLESQLSESEINRAQLEFEARKEQESRERLHSERDSQVEHRRSLQAQIDTVSPSLENLVQDRAKFDSELESLSGELEALNEQLAESRTAVQEGRVRLADLKSEERHLQENITKQNDFEKELHESLSQLEEEMRTTASEHDMLAERTETNRGAIQDELDRHKELENLVHGVEQEYRAGKESLEQKERAVRERRSQRDRVSEDLHAMELRASELRMQGEKIQERMREDYKYVVKEKAIDQELDTQKLRDTIENTKDRLQAMGPVNLLALDEYDKESERLEFLTSQKSDLLKAEENLKETIRVINRTAKEQFNSVFTDVQKNFVQVFTGFFENGKASLRLADPNDPLESEIVIEADPKGRRIGALTLLSGGEKTLTAISLLFAIYLVKPSPFCILDEVDAPLDDANIGRFVRAIRKFADNTQFLIVTHNKLTMRAADSLYGVTMEEEAVSKVVSVNFKDMELDKKTSKAA